MKKHSLFILFALLSFSLYAQVDSKYLQGAVPEVDGKVVFSRTIKVNNPITDEKIFELMNTWANKNYTSPDNTNQRVLLSNAVEKSIACKGEKVLMFKKAALMVDKATMAYQLILQIEGGECQATIKSIKYDYYEKSVKDNIHMAEDMITDKVALNGQKLYRYYDKFRIHTVDSINSIFNSIDVYLNGVKRQEGAAEAVANTATFVPQTVVAPVVVPVAAVAQEATFANSSANSSLAGFRKISPDKIPGNIIKLLNDGALITSGSGDKTYASLSTWGGLGVFGDKPVAFTFLNPQKNTVYTIDNGDTYTISFYTEAYKDALQYFGAAAAQNESSIKASGLSSIKTPSGAAAFAEAWMIIECKKLSTANQEATKEYNNNGSYKIYIGEILNVWVK